jgi:hypothetical protein
MLLIRFEWQAQRVRSIAAILWESQPGTAQNPVGCYLAAEWRLLYDRAWDTTGT